MDTTDTRAPDPVSYFREHAQTYHRFTSLVKWTAIHLAAVIVFLTLYCATSASFIGSLVVGVVIYALGAYAMRHGLSHSSEMQSAPPELQS